MKGLFTTEEIAECTHKELLQIYCHAVTASWKWFTTDQIAEKGPGVISYVIITAKGGATEVILYDGVDTSGQVIARLETTASQTRPFAFHNHLYFKKGLYVNVDGNTQGILIVWHPFPL